MHRVKTDKINSLNLEEGKVDKEERMNATAICRNQEGMRGLELDTKAEEKSYLEFGSEEKSNVEIDPKTKGQQFQSTINNLHSTSTLQTHNSTDGSFIAADTKTSSDLSVFSEQCFAKPSPFQKCVREMKMFALKNNKEQTHKDIHEILRMLEPIINRETTRKNVLKVFSNKIWDPGGFKSSSMFPFTHRNIL